MTITPSISQRQYLEGLQAKLQAALEASEQPVDDLSIGWDAEAERLQIYLETVIDQIGNYLN